MGIVESYQNNQLDNINNRLKSRYLNTIEAMIQILTYTETQYSTTDDEWVTYFNTCKSKFEANKLYLETTINPDYANCIRDIKFLYDELQLLKAKYNNTTPFDNLDMSISNIHNMSI